MTKRYRWGYLLVVATTLTSLLIWLSSMWYFDAWYETPFTYVAKVGSMGATTLICWTFILSTRFSAVERLFGGLDKVYKAHRRIGQAAFFLVLLHPVFLAARAIPEWGAFLGFFWFSADAVRNTGIIAVLMFVALIAVSLWVSLRYHVWKQTHHFFGLMLLVVIVHLIVANAEIMTFPVLRVWFFTWLAVAVFCYVYIRLLYRWIGPLFDYDVAKIERLGDITEVYLQPRRPRRRVAHQPGQFIYVSFDADSISAEPHPFSISSPPGEPLLRLSVKELGDWTSEVSSLTEGTRARVWGPYGKFGDSAHSDPDLELVFVAGGIGLTPFLSMINDDAFLRAESQKVQLIYSVEKPEDAQYHDEIESLDLGSESFVYHRHCSDDEGFLTASTIAEKVGGLDGKKFLICGPAPMMESIAEDLQNSGVATERIVTEDFSVI